MVRLPAIRPSVAVVIPSRNERGNIENAVRRLPRFAPEMEIIFVEGHSRDNTVDEIRRVIAAYPHLDIKLLQQDGRGKGDAVRKGFAHARGEVLMILDADLTVPPEDLPKFYLALAEGKAPPAAGGHPTGLPPLSVPHARVGSPGAWWVSTCPPPAP